MAWNETGNLRGPQGPAGMTHRGNYSSSTQYYPGDVVYASYQSYVAKVETKGVAPSTSSPNWSLVVARGATGTKGATGAAGPAGPQGPAGEAAPKIYGALRWGNFGWYDPPASSFHRLMATSGARLKVHADSGGVAVVSGANAYLRAPVTGWYLISATQTWGNAGAESGCGLATSATAGDVGVELWGDFNGYRHGVVSKAAYLTTGTVLYPWTWNGGRSGMSFADRGLTSEYSMVLLHQA